MAYKPNAAVPKRPTGGTDLQRFCARVVLPTDADGCWEWSGGHSNGYAQFTPSIERYAHRYSYMRFIGEVPEGLFLDHLCRNRGCVNPAHLEVVNTRTNVLRGVGVAAQNARRTHCIRGHPLSGDNVVIARYRDGSMKYRKCLACRRILAASYRKRKGTWAERLRAERQKIAALQAQVAALAAQLRAVTEDAATLETQGKGVGS